MLGYCKSEVHAFSSDCCFYERGTILTTVYGFDFTNPANRWYPTSSQAVYPCVQRKTQKLKRRHFLRNYDHYNRETLHNATLRHCASGHTILSDLHPRSGATGAVQNFEKNTKSTFSQEL